MYSFSTENWSRPPEEVKGLMAMMGRRIEAETPELHEEGVRMRFIGRRSDPVPTALVERMEWAEQLDRGQHAASRCSWRSTTAAGRRSSTQRGRSPQAPRKTSAPTSTRPRCTIQT